jgi:ABC-2 type transport system ATP-binding protein
MTIKTEHLSKRYASLTAVDDVSFEVQPGEVLGFLGPNGAGKTTTMRMLAGFVTPTAGRASICGHDIATAPIAAKSNLGYLPEGAPLYGEMKVAKFLAFIADLRKLDGDLRKRRLDYVTDRLQLGKVLEQSIETLSKGFRRRVGLAQALLHNPPVLILDEPTSGLDPNQIRDILRLITNLGQERTVIHSTHILSEVEATSDRVLIINRGRIVAQGTPRELIARGSGTSVFVSVRGEDCLAQIAAAPFAAAAEKSADLPDGFARVVVRGHEGRDVSVDLYRLAVGKGWTLSELRAETAKLEEVFADLTRGSNGGQA